MKINTDKIYLDLDGVFCDFNAKYLEVFGELPDRNENDKVKDKQMWRTIANHGTFYLDAPPMPDYKELWDFCKHHDPIFLTGVPHSIAHAEEQKRQWVANWIDPHVKVICCFSKDKSKFASPGDVLLDDWDRYINNWKSAGGIFIVHKNAKDSISQLKDIGFK